MITYTTSGNTSFDSVVNTGSPIRPMLKINKEIKSISGSSFDGYTDSSTTLAARLDNLSVSGYAIFDNKLNCGDPLVSSPGVTCGGYIIITSNYVAIAYTGVSSFTIYKDDSATMAPSFEEISPVSYLATNAAEIMMTACQGYTANTSGVIEDFGESLPASAPTFDKAFYVGNTPCGLFGVTVGTLSCNYVPTSARGIAKHILRAYAPVTDYQTYDDDEGIYITSSIRSTIASWISKVRSGSSSISKPSFCYRWKAPTSVLKSVTCSFDYLSPVRTDTYETADYVIFYNQDEDKQIGEGFREWVNTESSDYVDYVQSLNSDVATIFNTYKTNLEAYLKAAYKTLIANVTSLYKSFTRTFTRHTESGTISIVSDDSSRMSYSINRTFKYSPVLPSIPSISVLSGTDLAGASSTEMATNYQDCMNTMLNAGLAPVVSITKETIEVEDSDGESMSTEINTFSLNEDAVAKNYADEATNISEKISTELQQRMSDLMDYDSCVMTGDYYSTVTYQSGCKKKTASYFIFDDETTYTADCACMLNGTVYADKTTGETTSSSTGLDIMSVSKISDLVVRSVTYDEETNCYAVKVSYDLITPVIARYHCLVSSGTHYNNMLEIIRSAYATIAPDAVVSFDGKVAINPCGFTYDSGSKDFHGTKRNYDRDCYIFAPSLRFGITETFSVDAIANDLTTLDEDGQSSTALAETIEENVSAVQAMAQKRATEQLVEDLEDAGLLTDFYIAAEADSTLLPLEDAMKFYSMSSNLDAIITFYTAFKNVLSMNDDYNSGLTDSEIAVVNANIATIEKTLKYGGYTVTLNSSGEYEVSETDATFDFWATTASNFIPTQLEADYNLLGLYGAL